MNKIQKKVNRATKRVIRNGAVFTVLDATKKIDKRKTIYVFPTSNGLRGCNYNFIRKGVRELMKEGEI